MKDSQLLDGLAMVKQPCFGLIDGLEGSFIFQKRLPRLFSVSRNRSATVSEVGVHAGGRLEWS